MARIRTTGQTTVASAIKTNYDIDIFPNPTSNIVKIAINTQDIETANAEIYDLTGQMIFMKKFNSANFNINVNDFSRGTYILRLKSDSGEIIKTEKIIRQ